MKHVSKQHKGKIPNIITERGNTIMARNEVFTTSNGFTLEHREGINDYIVWVPSGFMEIDIFVRADYKNWNKPNPDEIVYEATASIRGGINLNAKELAKLITQLEGAKVAVTEIQAYLNGINQ